MDLFDNAQARQEGWEIWVRWPADGEKFELRRCAHSRIFLSNDDAWGHVIQQAMFSESLYHIAALKFMEVNAPKEFEFIECHASLLGISNGVSSNFHLLTEGKAA